MTSHEQAPEAPEATDPTAIIEAQSRQIETLTESLSDVKAMLSFEDRGWSLISGLHTDEHLEGLELDELKDISETIRPYLVAESLIKRGSELHIGYVHAKGMQIDGVMRDPNKRGAKTKLQALYDNKTNQDSIFSSLAREELQRARYADGNIFLACNKASQTVRRIPLDQIVQIQVNPDFPDEVWMYKRKWVPAKGQDPQERWYYTNRFEGRKVGSVVEKDGRRVQVAPEVIIDARFNKQIGWTLGVPDAVAAMPWSAAYNEIITYGRVVSKSLAAILYKITNKSAKGAATAGVKIAGMSGAGNAATMTEGADLQAVQTAGKGYDFASARPVAAMAATALNVPNMELLGDSSAAGSSYGAAQSLTPSTKNAMRMMQEAWVALYREVLDFMGVPVPRIWFDPMDEVDLYRHSQAIKLLADAMSDEEYRAMVLDLMNISGDPAAIPDALKLRSQAPAPAGAAAQQAAPDQGRSNGSGSGGRGSNDQRSDTISSKEMLQTMQNEDFLLRMESLVQRMEAASE